MIELRAQDKVSFISRANTDSASNHPAVICNLQITSGYLDWAPGLAIGYAAVEAMHQLQQQQSFHNI